MMPRCRSCDRYPLEGLLALGAFAAGVAACLVAGPTTVPFLEDNQHYFFMAERAASGVAPHVSNFDPKNMLAVLVSGASIAVGRLAGVSDVVAARVPSILAFALSAFLLAALTLRLTGSRAAAAAAGLALPTFRYLVLSATMGVRPKVFLILFMVAALYAAARRRWAAAGLGGGLAFLCWQPGAVVVVAVLLAMHMAREPLGRLATCAGLAAAPVVAYEAYFLLQGALGPQLTQSYLFPALYMHGELPAPDDAYRMLSWLWTTGYGWNVLPLAALAGLAVLGHRLVTNEVGTRDIIRQRPGWTVFVLTMLAAGAFTYYDHQGPPDLFFVLPFVTVLSGVAVEAVVDGLSELLNGIPSIAVATLLVVPFLVGTAHTVRSVRSSTPYDLNAQRRLAREVVDSGSKHSVYAVGRTTHLLALEHRGNWLSYSQFFRGVAGFLRDRGVGSPFVPCRRGRLPTIVLYRPGHRPPGWPGWLDRNYRRHPLPQFTNQGIEVWGLDGASSCSVTLPGQRLSPAGRVHRRPHSASHQDGWRTLSPPASQGVISPK